MAAATFEHMQGLMAPMTAQLQALQVGQTAMVQGLDAVTAKLNDIMLKVEQQNRDIDTHTHTHQNVGRGDKWFGQQTRDC